MTDVFTHWLCFFTGIAFTVWLFLIFRLVVSDLKEDRDKKELPQDEFKNNQK